MRKTTLLLTAILLTTGRLLASDETEVMGVVNQLVDAFNKGDIKKVLAVSTDDMSIIDDVPPHEWHGPGTCAKWLADYDADAKKNGITNGTVSISKPRHVDITADRAYVVVPAKYIYKKHGDPVKEKGNTWTLTLQKGDSGWHITGWAWAKR
jgi:ketosteroid isomerase-like protein